MEWLDPAANAEGIDNVANSAIMRGCGTLGSTPLVVISRGRSARDATKYPPGFVENVEQAWRQMQLELAKRSSNSRHIIASKSGNIINRHERGVIIAGIRQTVISVRNQ